MRAERRGVILVLALGCMTILAALMASLSDTSNATQKMLSRREAETRAAIAARSGLQFAVARLRQRGLRFINNAVPPPDPPLGADDLWIEDGTTKTVTLQAAFAPHEFASSSFSMKVAPQTAPPPARPGLGFVRDNLKSPTSLSQATLFTLTVTGYSTSADGRKLAAKTIAQTFVGANVVAVKTVETP